MSIATFARVRNLIGSTCRVYEADGLVGMPNSQNVTPERSDALAAVAGKRRVTAKR